MSDNTFREDSNSNPYAPPTSQNAPYENPSSNPLMIPAVVLLVLASLTLALFLLSLPNQIMLLGDIDTSTPRGMGEMAGRIVGTALMPLLNLIIVLGSISMIRLKSYRNAYLTSILAMIPLCTPCLVLGIPFGIWSLILLNREDVKRRFSEK